MFTVEDRRRVRDGLLAKARSDKRVVAGAEVGSTAGGGGDRWSDIDLTFGVADGAGIPDLIGDWTTFVAEKYRGVQLFDLPFLSSIYRVFLLPGNLQVDLSFTPGTEFGATGPNFTLLFGDAVKREFLEPAAASHIFGLGVHHAVRARICIERGRAWQGEYWISGVRDQALALECRLRGLPSGNGRGFDDLPEDVLDRFNQTLVRSLERKELLGSLKSAVDALLAAAAAQGDMGARVEGQLRMLTTEGSLS
jgi:hypothetical protein